MEPRKDQPFTPACPVPDANPGAILMAHGGAGRISQRLLDGIFLPAFDNPLLAARLDGAVGELGGARLAFTTDSYVVRPIFFPGGDIGTLAVNGTANDLAMCGARPAWMSAGFILEEGFPIADVCRVAESMKRAAAAAGVKIVTGDTKVVDAGKGDGLYLATSGVGEVVAGAPLGPEEVSEGDAILLSGDVGRHGMAIMSAREGFAFETALESDCASLVASVMDLLASGIAVRCLRDLTRGGLATALVEISEGAKRELRVDEALVPVISPVRGACEMLGLDPLYVANEGRFVAFVAASDAERALHVLHRHEVSRGACRIGVVGDASSRGLVTARGSVGTRRILDRLSGEQLPRIC